ncbi:Ldh family oxidoreductase [Elioraea rosea]|uniref:Ldh family oxidoreductase n=1 Tax=Elioraea rosea TaxID=2492390 RepID=UPI0011836380|nr:Ldh family oxidoreductase [Elioraea rosea]
MADEMKSFEPARLREIARTVFVAAGCPDAEAVAIAEHLVDANLAGHDSHGVIRILPYVKALQRGVVVAGLTPEVIRQEPALAVVDAANGFGQPAANAATDRACAMGETMGAATVLVRRTGHVGRLGAYAERAAAKGFATIILCNAPRPGGGVIAPWGGRERRLGASPIAMGFPRPPAAPFVLDFSTSYYAVGKLRVARNKGELLPEPAVVTADGAPTRDPNAYFGPPEGAMIPFGGHKGYALNVFTDLLAGMLSGGGADYPPPGTDEQGGNNLLIHAVSVEGATAGRMGNSSLADAIRAYAEWVTSATPLDPARPVMLPGEPEAAARKARAGGIALDPRTRAQIAEAAALVGAPDPTL